MSNSFYFHFKLDYFDLTEFYFWSKLEDQIKGFSHLGDGIKWLAGWVPKYIPLLNSRYKCVPTQLEAIFQKQLLELWNNRLLYFMARRLLCYKEISIEQTK